MKAWGVKLLRSRCLLLALLLAWAAAPASAEDVVRVPRAKVAKSSATLRQEVTLMNIQITVNGQVLAATLEDSAIARDFASLLPLTLDLEDYAATEKIAQLPRKLSMAGAPAGMTPTIGDITYYAPWGNLAVFYKGFGHAPGLVKLGRIRCDIQMLRGQGSFKARIEAAGSD